MVKTEYIEKMGTDLGPIYYGLWCEVTRLHVIWNEYIELFGSGVDRINLINEGASNFFWLVQQSFQFDIILKISRITDPPESYGKKENSNLTLRQLLAQIDAHLRPEIEVLVTNAVEKARICHTWRNKIIAHCDLKLTLKTAEPLANLLRNQIEDVITSIDSVMRAVSEQYKMGKTEFSQVVFPNGAEQLLRVIDDGVKAKQERQKFSPNFPHEKTVS